LRALKVTVEDHAQVLLDAIEKIEEVLTREPRCGESVKRLPEDDCPVPDTIQRLNSLFRPRGGPLQKQPSVIGPLS